MGTSDCFISFRKVTYAQHVKRAFWGPQLTLLNFYSELFHYINFSQMLPDVRNLKVGKIDGFGFLRKIGIIFDPKAST